MGFQEFQQNGGFSRVGYSALPWVKDVGLLVVGGLGGYFGPRIVGSFETRQANRQADAIMDRLVEKGYVMNPMAGLSSQPSQPGVAFYGGQNAQYESIVRALNEMNRTSQETVSVVNGLKTSFDGIETRLKNVETEVSQYKADKEKN